MFFLILQQQVTMKFVQNTSAFLGTQGQALVYLFQNTILFTLKYYEHIPSDNFICMMESLRGAMPLSVINL